MIPARSPGANPVRQASASSGVVSQVTLVMPSPPRSWASTSAITAVEDAGPALEAAAGSLAALPSRPSGTTTVTKASVRTLARVERLLQLVVDLAGPRRTAGPAVPGQPLVPFGAVLGDGAHQEQDLVDQLGPGGHVQQLAQPPALPLPFLDLAQPDARVDDGRGHRPGSGAVVLDDRDPGERGPVRWPVVDLHGLQRPGQVGLLQGVHLPSGRLGTKAGPPRQAAGGEGQQAATQPKVDRPRTGVTVTTVTVAQSARNSTAEIHAPAWTDQNTGIVEPATTASCHPDSPKNHPIRARL